MDFGDSARDDEVMHSARGDAERAGDLPVAHAASV
jgi:hypothetical protein